MGRFGNQAEQLLGSLLFAKSVNRTLVLPPFIHYKGVKPPELIPFDRVLKVEPILKYHRVVTLDTFMSGYARESWSNDSRVFYCYGPRASSIEKKHCDGLRGEPFATFWKPIHITQSKSFFYKPLRPLPEYASEWQTRFPVSEQPVITFVSAPSSFPTHQDSVAIQRYIELSEEVREVALKFKRESNISESTKYLSIHLRHGPDWKKACRHLLEDGETTQLFSSDQCTGHYRSQGLALPTLKYETCLPSVEHIVSKLKSVLERFESSGDRISIVHVATDYDDSQLWDRLMSELPNVKFFKQDHELETPMSSFIDLYLMTRANGFIGNCISSFSAFVTRLRLFQLGSSNLTFYFGQDFNIETPELKLSRNEL